MPIYIVLLAQEDPEFPLDENRHSHHAHLAFYRRLTYTFGETFALSLFRCCSLSLPSRRRGSRARPGVSVRAPADSRACVPCTCTGVRLPSTPPRSQRPTLLFCLRLFCSLLPRHAASGLLFGSVSSRRDRESAHDGERNRDIQATLALLARAPIRQRRRFAFRTICIPLSWRPAIRLLEI